MEWLLVLAAAAGSGFAAKRWRASRARAAHNRDELDGVRRLADEDVTILGEQLQRLDAEIDGRLLDEPTRVDYQAALDAYETAQRAVPRIKDPEDVSTITDTLSTGRYALACVQARVAGQPLPELRVPCFFNPQHGPSVTDVLWTKPGRGTRSVPACAQDAARIARHAMPEVRTVKIGPRIVPYWEAGKVFLPYGEGYFASTSMMTWAFATPILLESQIQGSAAYLGAFEHGGLGFGGGDGGGDGGGN